MTQPTSPRKALLLLSLMVLGLHLALLQRMPIHLSSTDANATVTFATRTLAAPEWPAPAVSPAPVKRPPKRAPKARPTAPAPPPAVLPAPAPEFVPESPPAPEAQPAAPPDLPAPSLAEVAAASSPSTMATASAAPPVVVDAASEAADPAPSQRDPMATFAPQGLPGSIKLIYKVEANKFPYSLNAELVWQQDAAHYFASLQVGAFGQYRTQTSRGAFGPRGLMPERFSDKYRSEVAAHFNWPTHQVTFSANTPTVVLQDGAQDRMSILIQLAALVASAPERYRPGTSLTLQTVGPRDADVWLFTVGEAEDLQVPSDPAGNIATLKLTRQPRQLYDQKMELWLAPALGYLPARIRLQEANGDFLDQRWFATATVDPL